MAANPRKALADVRQIAARRTAPIVLELDLTTDPVEGVPSDPVNLALSRRRTTLRDVVEALRFAADDPRVTVVVAHIAACGMPLARIQEIRAAIVAFRAAGGTAIAYADTFGEFGGGTAPYYLACAFDEIWLAPPGDCGLTGLGMETPFLRGALDRLGVSVEIGQRYEYKNAVNTLVERDFTPAHLEALSRIIESSSDQVVTGIAEGRAMSTDRVRRLIDLGPLAATVALEAGLVDHLGYRDEVYAAARARVARGPASADRAGAGSAGNGAAAGAGPVDQAPRSGDQPGADGRPGRGGPHGGDDTSRTPAALAGDAGSDAATGSAQGSAAQPVLMYASAYRRLAERREKSPVRRIAALTSGGPAALFFREQWHDLPAGGRDAEGEERSRSRGDDPGGRQEAGAEIVPLAPAVTRPHLDPRTSVVALIHGTGPVVLGTAMPTPLSGPAFTAEATAAALRSAASDPDVAAAVFRVSSPGGSYVASDLVRREAERFRASGRPLIVSMGDVAASGGYFVALASDAIVANPGTLTGSIGVFAGKQVVRELLDKVGVGFGAVAEGEHALMMSPRRPFTPGEREKLEEFLDRVYTDFLDKVATARRLSRSQVHTLARGRVWTGADAHAHGLVDVLGGLEQAIELAWSRAGLPAGATPRVRIVPKPSVLERIRPPRSSEDRGAAAAAAGFGPVLGGGAGLGLGSLLGAGAGLGIMGRLGAAMGAGFVAGLGAASGLGGPAGVGGGTGSGVGSGFAAGWGSLAPLAARLGLPVAGPLMMPPIGRIG